VRAAEAGLGSVARELAETELSATADHRPAQVKALREVQRGVIDSVARGGGDALLPVIFVHYLTDLEYVQRGESWMAAQNRLWIHDLVLRWIERHRDAASRHVGAQLFAAMGSAGYALEIDENNELALLRQAILAEKSGNYHDAQVWLDKLLAAHPRSHQGRLRRAIVLRRTGKHAEAFSQLTKLVEEPVLPAWIAVLAFQEMAEIERRERRQERAEKLLQLAIERLGTQELYLQLAFYLDERQRPDEAVAILNRMPMEAGGSSARHLYNSGPAEEIALARQQVEARLDQGVSELRVALAAPEPAYAGSGR
jgi:tetratricopeptide (TPR) repeat protein